MPDVEKLDLVFSVHSYIIIFCKTNDENWKKLSSFGFVCFLFKRFPFSKSFWHDNFPSSSSFFSTWSKCYWVINVRLGFYYSLHLDYLPFPTKEIATNTAAARALRRLNCSWAPLSSVKAIYIYLSYSTNIVSHLWQIYYLIFMETYKISLPIIFHCGSSEVLLCINYMCM